MRGAPRGLALLVGVAVLVANECAWAGPARVVVRASSCQPPLFDQKEFAEVLTAELMADGVLEVVVEPSTDAAAARRENASDAPLARLSLEDACSTSPTIVIDDAATDKSTRRRIDLGGVAPEMRARTAALAAAELLHASWNEVVLPKAPVPRAVVPPELGKAARDRTRIASTAPPPPPSMLRVFVSAGPEARWFFSDGLTVYGAALGVSWPVVEPLRVRGAAGFWAGERAVPLGSLALELATLAIGPCVGWGTQRLDVEVGAAIEGGAGIIGGKSASSAVRAGSGGGAVVSASVAGTGRVRLIAPLWLSVDLELGHVLKGVSAGVLGVPVVGFRGAEASARVGLALAR